MLPQPTRRLAGTPTFVPKKSAGCEMARTSLQGRETFLPKRASWAHRTRDSQPCAGSRVPELRPGVRGDGGKSPSVGPRAPGLGAAQESVHEGLEFVKGRSVPETLKSQPTYTDKKLAVERLLDAIDDHPDAPWAKTLLEGEFGKRAPLVIKEIDEATAADRNLMSARNERAKAYGPTYEAYLSFKRVVRSALGPASKEYRSIHIRSNGSIEDDPAEPNQPNQPTPVNPPVNPPVPPTP